MPVDWSPFVAFVRRHQRFVLTTHVRPDADGLGSLQALAEALESLGKRVERLIGSEFPPRCDFLDPDNRIQVFNAAGSHVPQGDALIVLDTGTWNQLADVGPFVQAFTGERVVIDHHATQDDLGATRFVDTGVEATARLAFDAIRALDLPLTKSMATALFAAVVWDTGWFRHSSTTPWTFELGAALVAAGAKPTPIYEALFERESQPGLKLRGRYLERIETRAQGKIAFSFVPFRDYAETGATPHDTEDFIEYPRSIAGVEVALHFIEKRDTDIKVSFRARQLNVAKIAEQFGGGGHKLASGATLPGPLDAARDRVLQAVESALQQS
jgi:bifunctional oligoribonuclease and PAP phosphatase NrnA